MQYRFIVPFILEAQRKVEESRKMLVLTHHECEEARKKQQDTHHVCNKCQGRRKCLSGGYKLAIQNKKAAAWEYKKQQAELRKLEGLCSVKPPQVDPQEEEKIDFVMKQLERLNAEKYYDFASDTFLPFDREYARRYVRAMPFNTILDDLSSDVPSRLQTLN